MHAIYTLVISFVISAGISVGLLPLRMENMTLIVIGWDSFSLSMLVISTILFTGMHPRQIRVLAKTEDAGRIVVFVIVVVATICSLPGILILLGNKGNWLLTNGLENFI